jgi:hypothetical protein
MGGFSGDRAMAVAGPGEWESPVKAGSLVLYAWVQAGLLSRADPAVGGAGNWRGGHWRGGRFWPWWGVGAGVALTAAWPYYGGYG